MMNDIKPQAVFSSLFHRTNSFRNKTRQPNASCQGICQIMYASYGIQSCAMHVISCSEKIKIVKHSHMPQARNYEQARFRFRKIRCWRLIRKINASRASRIEHTTINSFVTGMVDWPFGWGVNSKRKQQVGIIDEK